MVRDRSHRFGQLTRRDGRASTATDDLAAATSTFDKPARAPSELLTYRALGGRRREADGQPLDPADERDAHGVERRRLRGHLDVGEAREQLPERDGDLAPR